MKSIVVLMMGALAVAASNLLPLLFMIPAGDSVMAYAQIQCFSEQLWQGILYPRWCMKANSGMGSPIPIFYFPLPFYIAALFYPLHHFGVGADQQLLLGIFLASTVAFVTCVVWLRGVVSNKVAWIGAFLYVWGAYRGEVLARMSYAEYWCVSFLPLLFLYIRRMCERPRKTWPQLALVITLCLFCHAPLAVMGLMGGGLFVLIYTRANLKTFSYLIGAGVLAGMVGAFHYWPPTYLMPTLVDGIAQYWQGRWVNSFVDDPQLYIENFWPVVGLGLFSLITLVVMAVVACKRSIFPEAAGREAWAWGGIVIFSLFMLFSPSEAIWAIVKALLGFQMPWRMSALILLATIFMLVLISQYVWQNRRTWTGDVLALTMLFIFGQLFYYTGISPDKESTFLHQRLVKEQPILAFFMMRGMDTKYADGFDAFFADFVDRPNRAQTEWVSGQGDLHVEQWNAKGIVVSGQAKQDGQLRLEHFYYPIWKATINGQPAPITVEPEKGRMLLAVPAGVFTVSLTQHYWAMLPPYFPIAWVALALGLFIIAAGFWRNRRPA